MSIILACAALLLVISLLIILNRGLFHKLSANIEQVSRSARELYDMRILDTRTLLSSIPCPKVAQAVSELERAKTRDDQWDAEQRYQALLPAYLTRCEAELPEDSALRELLIKLPEINRLRDQHRTYANSLILFYNRKQKSIPACLIARSMKLTTLNLI